MLFYSDAILGMHYYAPRTFLYVRQLLCQKQALVYVSEIGVVM